MDCIFLSGLKTAREDKQCRVAKRMSNVEQGILNIEMMNRCAPSYIYKQMAISAFM